MVIARNRNFNIRRIILRNPPVNPQYCENLFNRRPTPVLVVHPEPELVKPALQSSRRIKPCNPPIRALQPAILERYPFSAPSTCSVWRIPHCICIVLRKQHSPVYFKRIAVNIPIERSENCRVIHYEREIINRLPPVPAHIQLHKIQPILREQCDLLNLRKLELRRHPCSQLHASLLMVCPQPRFRVFKNRAVFPWILPHEPNIISVIVFACSFIRIRIEIRLKPHRLAALAFFSQLNNGRPWRASGRERIYPPMPLVKHVCLEPNPIYGFRDIRVCSVP